jgi:hypothetical protein
LINEGYEVGVLVHLAVVSDAMHDGDWQGVVPFSKGARCVAFLGIIVS